MCPAVEENLAKLSRHPSGKIKLCVKKCSVPVRYNRRRDGLSQERLESGKNFPSSMRVRRAYIMEDNSEPVLCGVCFDTLLSFEDMHE
jgi:hypothetical protein